MPQREMIFSDYLRVVVKHKFTVMIVTVLVAVATYVWSTRKQAMYSSETQIKIQRLQTFADFFSLMMISSSDPMQDYLFLITGDQVMNKASEALTGTGQPTRPNELAPSIKATRIEGSDLLAISAQGPSPEIAQARCNAVVDAFEDMHRSMMNQNNDDEYAHITNSLNQAAESLAKLQADHAERLRKLPAGGGALGESDVLRSMLADARVKLQALNDGDISASGPRPAQADGGAPSDSDMLRSRLLDARIKLQTLVDSGNYSDDYPEIVSQKAVISVLQAQLKTATQQEQVQQKAAVRKEIVNQKAVVAALQEQLKVAMQRDAELGTIQRDHEQKRQVLEEVISLLTKRLEESRISRTRVTERIERVKSSEPGRKITTPALYLTSIGLLLGLMLGVVLAFVAESLDTSLRTLSEIEETFHLPILGVIPHFSPHEEDIPIRPEGFVDRMKYSPFVSSFRLLWRASLAAMTRGRTRKDLQPQSTSSSLIVPFHPRSPATEGYRAIRTNLLLTAGDKKLGAILVSSAGPAEGKSTTVINLAFAFAQAGKRILLVGANMRRPSLYRMFGLTRERGLADILTGELSWREAIKDYRDIALGTRAAEGLASTPGTENLSLITAGSRTTQPAEWLSMPVFESLVREWEAEFDVILIDGPPILPVPDSVIMSAAVGKSMLVYQVGSTNRDSMLRAISLIQKAGAKILGLVMNDLHASWGSSPDYFHYRGYYGRPDKR